MTARGQHAIGQIVYRHGLAGRLLRISIVAAGVAYGLSSLAVRLETFTAPYVYMKDIVQEYLTGRAVLDRIDPYLPTSELAERYLGLMPHTSFARHPTPHPPPTAVLFAPLSVFDFPTLAVIWLGVEVAALVVSLYLVFHATGAKPSIPRLSVLAVSLIALYPFGDEIVFGQLMLLILALLSGAWLACRNDRPFLGGVLLGLSILIKPIAWPLVLLFAMRKDWRVATGSCATVVAGYLATGLIVGVATPVSYFRDVLPAVTDIYRTTAANLSLWSLGWRLFYGTGSTVFGGLSGMSAPPLVTWPTGAAVTSAAVPALALVLAWLAVRRHRGVDVPVGVGICASILVNPISWGHYLVLASIPAAQVILWLVKSRFPVKETNLALLVALLLVPSFRQLASAAFSLFGQTGTEPTQMSVPFAPSLITFLPALGVLGLGWLTWYLVKPRGQDGSIEREVWRRHA